MLEHSIFFSFETVSITVKKGVTLRLSYASLSEFVGQLSSSRWEILALRSLTVIKTKIIARSFPSWRYQDFWGTPAVLLKD